MINTNLIIGRLGSGKTTCIKHLISNIPENEYWVIIVNEFGQIGIDSALISDQQESNTSVTEISGGCICCAAQSQLRVTLTQLIRKHRPDRIIIEATGLGHPAGIVDLLRDEFLREIIEIDSIITLMDISLFNLPYNPLDKKSLLSTDNLKQQVQLADIIVLNKMDLAKDSNIDHCHTYFDTIYPKKNKILFTEKGTIDTKYLTLKSDIENKSIKNTIQSKPYSSHSTTLSVNNFTIEYFSSESDEYMSFGYIFPDNLIFNRKKLETSFKQAFDNNNYELVRLKAIFNGGKFWHAFNYTGDDNDIAESFYRRDSRIELISKNKKLDITSFQELLFSCAKGLL